MSHTVRTTWRVWLALMLITLYACGVQAQSWLDADIGSPPVAGSSSFSNGVLTVQGSGTGDTCNGTDQVHYTYQSNAGGDVEIIARMTSFTQATAHARAGIMVRTGNTANATTANVVLAYQDAGDGNNNLAFTAFDQASGTYGTNWGVETRMQFPLWLRFDRIGQNFAVYKSPDGVIWSMISNNSGWQFTPSGAIEVGFFVSSDGAASSASATFDTITIGTPNMGYSTSWFGNSFGGTTLGAGCADNYVSNWISAMWTAPDGTCYTNSSYDEGGQSAKIYQNGAVVNSFGHGGLWFGNDMCGEGSITSDGTKMYLAVKSGYAGNLCYIAQTDMQNDPSSSQPMLFATDLWDGTKGLDVVSGMAVVGNELYVADEKDNEILVAQTNYPLYSPDYYSEFLSTTNSISTTGVSNAAPEVVYQTERCGLSGCGVSYVIPGMNNSTTYSVRCHFCEYTETQTGKRVFNVHAGSQQVLNYDLVAQTNGEDFVAVVLTIPNVQTDGSGNISLSLWPSAGATDAPVLCGFEILNPNGSDAFALACGQPAVGNFQTELCEQTNLEFHFDRPGPMVADKRGNLWIIQEANDFPIATTMTTQYQGAVLCYNTNGSYTGIEITGVANPAALAYDAVNDRLLIADNTNEDIAIYTDLATTPTLQTTFGVRGGLYSGANPGLLDDPANGGYARFDGITGIGIDSSGNIYVSTGMQGSDLREFTSSGSLVWMLNGLPFCNCPAIDPDSETDVYASYFHAKMNYANTAPGSEWSYYGFNWNPARYSVPSNQYFSQAIVRHVGNAKILYTSGQGDVGQVSIFRYNGEICVPCGSIANNGATIWIDQNGDGVQTPNEVSNGFAPGYLNRCTVDQHGDIWLCCLGNTTPLLRHFFCQGLNNSGAPVYNFSNFEDIPYPNPGPSAWGQWESAHYDAVNDIMYLLGPVKFAANGDSLSYLARYDAWSTGNQTARWLIDLPDPSTSADFPYEVGDGFLWDGLDVAGTNIYLAELWGPVHVFNADTGVMTGILSPGPEVAGCSAWEDAAMGCTAYQRANGETIVFTENSGYDAKCNMFRIPPTTTCAAPTCSPWAGNLSYGQAITLRTATAGASIRYTTDGSMPTETHGTIYNGALSITTGVCTLQAIAYAAGMTDSTVTSCVYQLQCALPTFTPQAGAYGSAQSVSIISMVSGATICYTTDGSTPTETHGTVYTTPVNISNTTELKAIAYITGMADSNVAAGQYLFQSAGSWYTDSLTQGSWWSQTGGYVYGGNGYVLCAWNNGTDVLNLSGSYVQSVTPSGQGNYCWEMNPADQRAPINPATGTSSAACWYSGSTYDVQVALVNPNDGIIHRMAVYCLDWDDWTGGRKETLDLLNPSTGQSELLGGPVSLSNFQNGIWVVFYFTGNVELQITNTNGNANALISVIAFDSQCTTPVYNPAPGAYGSAQNVTITSATGGAAIRYTTDGSTPTETAGTLYTTPVAISATTVLNAIAYQTGMADSAMSSGLYSLQGAGALGTDTTTQGSWWSSGGAYNYGGNGYVLCAWNAGMDVVNLTGSYVQSVTPSGQSNWCWAANQSDIRAPINPATGTRNAACWYSGGSYDALITLVNPNDGITHRMAVYCLDWDNYGGGRSETLNLLNPSTGQSELSGGPVSLSNFRNGVWVIFSFTGNVELQITNTNGNANAVISVIAFDNQCSIPVYHPAPGIYESAQDVTISTATGGATIRYTTDGSIPSETHGEVYGHPVNISANTTLQAIAYKAGASDSAVAAGHYYIPSSGSCYTDYLTQGSWWSPAGGYVYGNDGYVLCAWNSDNSDVVSLNGSYVQSVTPINYTGYYVAYCDSPANQTDPRTLINPATEHARRRRMVLQWRVSRFFLRCRGDARPSRRWPGASYGGILLVYMGGHGNFRYAESLHRAIRVERRSDFPAE